MLLLVIFTMSNMKSKCVFEKALEYDPSLFGPHVVLAGLAPAGSEKEAMHVEKAKENVAENETSKVFVSLLICLDNLVGGL